MPRLRVGLLLAAILLSPLALGLPLPTIAACGSTQTEGCEVWATRITHTGADRAFRARMSPDGSTLYVMAENQKATPTGSTFSLMLWAFSTTDGSQRWNASEIAAAWHHQDTLSVSPDGSRVYMAGRNGSGFVNFASVFAYDAATGERLWVSSAHAWSHPNSIAVSPDGGAVYLVGRIHVNSYDYYTAAFNATTGALLWAKSYDGRGTPIIPGSDEAYDVAVSADGMRVYVTGGSDSPTVSLSTDYVTIAYNATTGERLWLAREDGDRDLWTTVYPFYTSVGRAYRIDSNPDGRHLHVVGDFGTFTYDGETGREIWGDPQFYTDCLQRPPTNPCGGSAGSCSDTQFCTQRLSRDGRILLSQDEYGVAAIDALTGENLWTAKVQDDDNLLGTGPGHGLDMTLSQDGTRLYVTSKLTHLSNVPFSGNDPSFYTQALDVRTGLPIWKVKYDGGNAYPVGVFASPDGSRVYVTGSTSGEQELATVTYDPRMGFDGTPP